MAQFVLVASNVSAVHFEKAMEVKIKAGDKVRFVPQGNQQAGTIISPGMVSVKPQGQTAEVLNNVRFEWDHSGVEFGADLMKALAGHHTHDRSAEVQPGAAA